MTTLGLIWQILNLNRRRAVAILLLQGLAAIAEGFGIATVLPALLLMISGPELQSSGALANGVQAIMTAIGLPMQLSVLLTLMVGAVMLKSVFMFFAWTQIGNASASVAAELRYRLLKALAKARWSYFVDQPIGSLNNAAGAQTIRAAGIFMLVCELISEVLQLVVYLSLALLVTTWYVTVGAFVLAGILFLTMARLRDLRREAERRENTALDQLSVRITDGLRSFKALKAMGVESDFVSLLNRETHNINMAQRLTARVTAILRSASEPIIAVALAIAIYLAVTVSKVAVTELLYVALLFSRTVGRAASLQKMFHNLAGKEVIYQSLAEIIAKARSQAEAKGGSKTIEMSGSIVFDDVSFSHGDTPILRHVKLCCSEGSLMVIRGPSGSGKTTLIDLVIGLIRPTSGEIFVDGTPFGEIDVRYWRSRLGYVPQESTMLQVSVADNISLGREGITEADVERALRRSEAWSFVKQLPGGLRGFIGENAARLSGGQKQRLAIARALVHRPRLLILDEPTSALDAETAEGITRTLRRLAAEEGVTVIAVTHHEAVVNVADVLYDISAGQVRLVGPARDVEEAARPATGAAAVSG
jgi:ATP-binding cassette subfamily C protein